MVSYGNRIIIFPHKLFLFSGGPVTAFEPDALGRGVGRYLLIGTVHGAFEDCSNRHPGIFVKTDELSVLEFLQKEVFGQGLFYLVLFCILIKIPAKSNFKFL